MSIRDAIDKLVNRVSLSEAEMIEAMNQIMTGEATPLQVASFLTALRMKGESVEEVTGAARVMREKAHRVQVGSKTVIDTCGTGGDQKGTFNISTTAAFVVAGAGINVAKHGNRSVSSQSGSADVLGALGVKVDAPKEQRGGVHRQDRHRLSLRAATSRSDEIRRPAAPRYRHSHGF